jgi:Apea-like HEPN
MLCCMSSKSPAIPVAGRIPAVKPLAAEIGAAKRGKETVADSADWLVEQSQNLSQRWDDFEDLGIAAYGGDAKAKSACHHIIVIRAEMARRLWARHIFVGVTVLDDLLFKTVCAGDADPILATLRALKSSKLDFQSLLVFPLQDYGVLAAGLLRPLRGSSTYTLDVTRRFVLSPQTNDLTRTTDLINSVAPPLGVRKPVRHALIEHWRKSRDARWLENNPLLIAGVASISGYYYENEFLLLGRVKALTSAVAMLSTLQPSTERREARLFSSSQINNFETRDIQHYILLSDANGEYLTGRAVPIHRRRAVDSLSRLEIDLDPSYWDRRSVAANELYLAVDNLFNGYLQHSVGKSREDTLSRTYRKLFDAVEYFRLSNQGRDHDWTAAVSLATAFEMILTDQFDRGVADRLCRRTALLLRGVRGTRGYQKAVVDLYDARSGTVHRGESADIDLDMARRAFVLVFLAVMRRMHSLKPAQTQPMRFLTGDPKA